MVSELVLPCLILCTKGCLSPLEAGVKGGVEDDVPPPVEDDRQPGSSSSLEAGVKSGVEDDGQPAPPY